MNPKSFEIEIPNPKKRIYQAISILIAGMNLLSFALTVSWVGEEKIGVPISGVILNLILILVLLLKRKINLTAYLQPSVIFIVSALLWMYLGAYWIAISLLAFGGMGIFSQRKNSIRIDTDGIRYPSFPIKNYSWQSVHQVILKDSVLTLDLEGNRFLQFTISDSALEKIDVEAFNRFCERQAVRVISV